jgi:gamma-glutamyl:cysteine ligase YbdK (ATP-grasp superfamily)
MSTSAMAPPSSIRIASLLPSLTEVVASIPSLRDKLVAVTHEVRAVVVSTALRCCCCLFCPWRRWVLRTVLATPAAA